MSKFARIGTITGWIQCFNHRILNKTVVLDNLAVPHIAMPTQCKEPFFLSDTVLVSNCHHKFIKEWIKPQHFPNVKNIHLLNVYDPYKDSPIQVEMFPEFNKNLVIFHANCNQFDRYNLFFNQYIDEEKIKKERNVV